MPTHKRPNYKRLEETKPCPICGAQVKIRGVGAHIRLMHQNAPKTVYKRHSGLSEAAPPPVPKNVPQSVKNAIQDETATRWAIWAAAMYLLIKFAKTIPNTSREGNKPKQSGVLRTR